MIFQVWIKYTFVDVHLICKIVCHLVMPGFIQSVYISYNCKSFPKSLGIFATFWKNLAPSSRNIWKWSSGMLLFPSVLDNSGWEYKTGELQWGSLIANRNLLSWIQCNLLSPDVYKCEGKGRVKPHDLHKGPQCNDSMSFQLFCSKSKKLWNHPNIFLEVK